MAPAMPTPRIHLGAGDPVVGPAVVLTAPVAADPYETEIVTGLELRLVPSPTEGEGVLFERVAVSDHAPAVHLDVAWETPLVPAVPVLVSPRRTAAGQLTCGCWQSLRLLGSARRHDHDSLSGSSATGGCPACGRGRHA